VDALHVRIDAAAAVLGLGQALLDPLEPLAVAPGKVQVAYGKAPFAPKLIVAIEPLVLEESVHRATPPTAKCIRVALGGHRLAAVEAARGRNRCVAMDPCAQALRGRRQGRGILPDGNHRAVIAEQTPCPG
jgi:hypothetical protein